MRKPGKKHDILYAVVRVDKPFPSFVYEDMPIWITVKEVTWDEEFARSEVDRLNELNADKECYYYWTITRLRHGDCPPEN